MLTRHRLFSKQSLVTHVITFIFTSLLSTTSWAKPTVIDYSYKVVQQFPHDPDSFTQGLEIHNDLIYESAGQYGKSRLFIRPLTSITPIKQHQLKDSLFAEGITVLNNKVFQLTWKSERVFVYQQDTLKLMAEKKIKGQGWGLTNNGKQLIMSNGTSTLQFIDPKTFAIDRRLDVTINNRPVSRLNELEWVNGLIYANVWHSNWIIMIDPDTGKVIGRVNLNGLLPTSKRTANIDVLNGIAYDKDGDRLLITGKNWPSLFHLELTPKPN